MDFFCQTWTMHYLFYRIDRNATLEETIQFLQPGGEKEVAVRPITSKGNVPLPFSRLSI